MPVPFTHHWWPSYPRDVQPSYCIGTGGTCASNKGGSMKLTREINCLSHEGLGLSNFHDGHSAMMVVGASVEAEMKLPQDSPRL